MITVNSSREYNDLLKQGYVYVPGQGFGPPVLPQPKPAAPAPTMSGPAESTVTGIEPQALDAILYGKEIAEYVGGTMRIGGRIIEGPFFDNAASTTANPIVEYIASFAHYANGDSGTIAVTEFSLRGRVVWTVADGATIDGLDVEFRLGTEDQLPFDSSITRFGARALPYKGHILARVIVSLNQFAGIVPFPSVLVEDSSFGDPDDGIPRQDALEIILQTARLEADEYEVDVTGAWDACIIPEKSDMLTLLQMFRKEYPNWDITFTDKLRITERAAYTVDLNLTRGKIMKDSWSCSRSEPLTQPRERLLRFIDSGRDYEFNTATARQEIFPLATTSSIESETIELPIVMPANTAAADNFFSLFAQDVASLKMEWIGTVDTFGLAPGDAVRFNDTTTGLDLFMRVSEVSRNWSDFTVDVRANMAYNCGLSASILDTLGPTGAYSFSRFLLSTYTGAKYTTMAGTQITHWLDQSGNGRDLTYRNTNVIRPSLSTASPANIACGDFTPVNYLSSYPHILSDFISSAAGYFIVSFIPEVMDAPGIDYPEGIVNGGGYWGVGTGTGNVLVGMNWDGNDDWTSMSITASAPHVIEWRHESGTLYVRLDGTTEVSVASGNTLMTDIDLLVGTWAKSLLGSFDGQIFELVLFDYIPSLADRDAMVADFMGQMGA